MYIDLIPHSFVRGRGYWKLNNKILYEKEYLEMMNSSLNELCTQKLTKNPQDIWEAAKLRIIGESQMYSRERALNRKMIINQLEEQVQKMNEKEATEMSDSETKLLERTKSDLNNFKDEHIQGVIFRSTAQWHNDGEKCTKYFFNLEKSRSGAKNMNCLITDSGMEIRNPEQILYKQYKFYEKLYASEDVSPFEFKNEQQFELDHVEKDKLNEETFSEEELKTAIKTTARNKAPGIDGISAEFYIMFYSKIKTLLLPAINYAFKSGTLHSSALRGVISLIPKRNEDTRFLRNLRPISLLCNDYKLIEKIIANRMKPILTKIVHTDQKGFMADRRISCNIRRVLDIMTIMEQEDEPALIVSVDFLKCFDRIELSAILHAIDYFQLGENFKTWTKRSTTNQPLAL